MVVVLPQAPIEMDRHQTLMEVNPQDDIDLHRRHQGARLQDATGLVSAHAIEILILTGPAHIRGQDPGRRDQDLSHRVRVVVLHHVVVVGTEVGIYHRPQVEQGGGGVQAIQAIPATVIEAAVEVETEAGIGDNIRLDVRMESTKCITIPHQLRISFLITFSFDP